MNNPLLRYAFLFIAACFVAGMVFLTGCTSAPSKTGKLDDFDEFVTVKMAEMMVETGLSHSKKRKFAMPPQEIAAYLQD